MLVYLHQGSNATGSNLRSCRWPPRQHASKVRLMLSPWWLLHCRVSMAAHHRSPAEDSLLTCIPGMQQFVSSFLQRGSQPRWPDVGGGGAPWYYEESGTWTLIGNMETSIGRDPRMCLTMTTMIYWKQEGSGLWLPMIQYPSLLKIDVCKESPSKWSIEM